MPRIVWTENASEQLTDIESDELEDQLIGLAFGLNRFPERGRRVPELFGDPEYDIVREVILPRKARLLYLFMPDSDEVLVLGIILKGGIFVATCSALTSIRSYVRSDHARIAEL